MSEYSSYESGGNNDNNIHAWRLNTELSNMKKRKNLKNLIRPTTYYNNGTEKKIFSCIICTKNFGRLWNLERHMKNIHNERCPMYI